jgi:hypothetical protein
MHDYSTFGNFDTPSPSLSAPSAANTTRCHWRNAVASPTCTEGCQAGGHLFDPVISAIIDHLVTIETELAAVRRLVEEIGL